MPMRVLIVIDETPFYHPNFVNDLIKNLKSKDFEVFGGNVVQIEKKNSIEKYLISNFYRMHFNEILILSLKKIFFSILNIIFPKGLNNKFFSVKAAFKKNKVNFFNIKKNINKEKYLKKIIDINPDLIISSNSLIFGTDILKIPKHGCLNRHTALLPSYGGIWPVLQAISHNESKTGVSIHQMNNKIDDGAIYAQSEIDISYNKNMSTIYKAAFSISSQLIINAIDNLLNKKKELISSGNKSYFSFPTKQEWSNFRKNGGRFV
jgi:methionyl-tRNA formyltransferase